MNVRNVVLSAALALVAYCPVAQAQEFESIFNNTVDDRRVVALAVTGAHYIGDLIDELRPYATPDTTLIAYINHAAVSEAHPLVVYVDGELVVFSSQPPSVSTPPTFEDSLQEATLIERGERSGALCDDGSTTDITHDGACSLNGGIDSWLYAAVAVVDPERVVAVICDDYRLVAGTGELCGDAEILTPVLGRPYPLHYATEVTASMETPPTAEGDNGPTERDVAPLPDPAVDTPTVEASSVSWTERRAGQVGYVWEVSLDNPNGQPVRAIVTVNMRDEDGEIIHSDERAVALDGRERKSFVDEGAVEEETALEADRWTFEVVLAPEILEPEIDPAEAANVSLVVDPVLEEVLITNHGDEEVDLNGWTLSSSIGGESFTFRFFKLSPGQAVMLTSGDGARSRLPEIYLWTSSEVWSDEGDAAELRDQHGRLRAKTNPDGTAAVITEAERRSFAGRSASSRRFNR